MVTQCPRHLSSGRSVTQPHPVASQMMSRPEDRGDSIARPRASQRGVCGQAQAWRRPGFSAAFAKCYIRVQDFHRNLPRIPAPACESSLQKGNGGKRMEGACPRAVCALIATELYRKPRHLASGHCAFRSGSSGGASVHADSHTKKLSLSRGPRGPSTLDLLGCHHSHQPRFEPWIPSIH